MFFESINSIYISLTLEWDFFLHIEPSTRALEYRKEKDKSVSAERQSTIIMQLEFHSFLPLSIFLLSCFHRSKACEACNRFLFAFFHLHILVLFSLSSFNDPFACHSQSLQPAALSDKMIARTIYSVEVRSQLSTSGVNWSSYFWGEKCSPTWRDAT